MVWTSANGPKCPVSPEDRGETAPDVRTALAAELAEYRKFRYMGDCKCGDCQLIPLELLNRAIEALALSRPECK